MPFLSEEYAEYERAQQPNTIKCRGCGKTEVVEDEELDAEWERAKGQHPSITRREALNSMSFCKACS